MSLETSLPFQNRPACSEALHGLQIAVRGSFSDKLKYVHTADMLLQTSTCRSRFLIASSQHFGRIVSVIKVFRPKTENALLGNFRPKIFGGRIFGASLMFTIYRDSSPKTENVMFIRLPPEHPRCRCFFSRTQTKISNSNRCSHILPVNGIRGFESQKTYSDKTK